MAKIRNVTLTPELIASLENMLNTAPDDFVVAAGKHLNGGFTSPDAIRRRLNVMLHSGAMIEPWFAHWFRFGMGAAQAVAALSPDGLRGAFDGLAALGGRHNLLLAALFDPREEIYKVGAEKLALRPPEAKPDFAAAKRAMTEWIDGSLLYFAGITLTPKQPEPGSETDKPSEEKEVDLDEIFGTMETLRKHAEKQMKANDNLRRGIEEQGRKQQSRLDAAARRAADEKKKIVAEREDARRQVLRLQKEKTALTARVDELNAAQQAVISKGVEENTSQLVRKWLTAPRETERTLEQVTGSDLLTRVEQAIESQARQDRLTGNRLELERQLARLREARDRLHGAATTALCPIPQLRELLAEMDAEIARVGKALTGQRPVDPLAEKLLLTINHAASWEEARHASTLVEQLGEAELIPHDDRRRLFDALQHKFSLLEETNRARHGEQRDHGWSLRDAIFRNQPSLLLLDGHNILFGLEDLFRPHYEEGGKPGRAARDRLIQIVRRLLDGRENLHARICFDGPHHEVITVSPRIAIEFSGGRGEHRADQRIADHVAWRSPDQLGQAWFVITDDRAVRREALKNGARYVANDLFAVLLNDFNCLAPAPLVAA